MNKLQDNDPIFDQLDILYDADDFEGMLRLIHSVPREQWNTRLWFFLVSTYNNLDEYATANQELQLMRPTLTEDKDIGKWFYMRAYMQYYSQHHIFALWSLYEAQKYAPDYEGVVDFLPEVEEYVNTKKYEIADILHAIQSKINELIENHVSPENEELDDSDFAMLLSMPAAFRKVPGIEQCMGTKNFYKCTDEHAKQETRNFIKEMFQAENPEQLAKALREEYHVNAEYQDFVSFWNKQPNFDITKLNESGRICFESFKNFAEIFRDYVPKAGLLAFEITEKLNWLRIAYACDLITNTTYASTILLYAQDAKKNFHSWEEYAYSYLCGSAYYMFTTGSSNLIDALNNLQSNSALLPHTDWFYHQWPEPDNAVTKEISYMTILPKNEDVLKDFNGIVNRLTSNPQIEIGSVLDEEDFQVQVTIRGDEYVVGLEVIDVTIPEMFRTQHFFPDIDMEAIRETHTGLLVSMLYGDDALKSYHDQLKLVHTIFPDALAVLDEGAEKILSGKWIALAACSEVPPAPRYLFTVQAVSGDSDEVWLHSHGLNRCGLPEVEILSSTKETYESHYHVMENVALRLLESEEPIEDKEAIYIAMLEEQIPLVATLVDWEEALSFYPDITLGNELDRADGHNHDTKVIFCYPNKDAYDCQNYSPISIYDQYLEHNPLYMISTQETIRMRNLAKERISYMIAAIGQQDVTVIVKVGLETDEEFQQESSHEHIWFEAVKLIENGFVGELTQDTYYIKNLHKGDILNCNYEDITDWRILLPNATISPDDVYQIPDITHWI